MELDAWCPSLLGMVILSLRGYLFIYLFIYIFKIFFLMWTIFKVFTLNLLYIIGLPWWLRW